MPTTPRNTRAQSASQSASQPRTQSQSQPQSQTRSAPRRSAVPIVELPSSRSTLKPSSSSSVNTDTPPRSRQRSTRSATATPTNLHHHKTADELALEEAEEILGHDLEVDHHDARSRRHRRLSRLRSLSQPPGPEIELGEEVFPEGEGEVKGEESALEIEDDSERAKLTLGDQAKDLTDEEGAEPLEREKSEDTVVAGQVADGAESASPEPATAAWEKSSVVSSSSGTVSDIGDNDSQHDTEQPTVATPEAAEAAVDADVVSSSDDSSDSDSESETESEVDSDSDEDDDDAQLDKLLQAAKLSAAKASTKTNDQNLLGGDGDVVSFDQDDQEKQRRREAPIPDISITKMPKPHLSFSADGAARATDAAPIIAGPSRVRYSKGEKVPELDARPYERTMSKREKAAQPRKATASELWSTLPAPKADLLAQMKRDYQALSLSNSLDPKRFMKGGNRSGKIPETFAIGTLVEAPRHLQDTTLTREKQYRPGQLVQSLTRDDDTGSYAKRKYGDLQSKRMENGRGNGWKKQRGWKP